MGVRLQLCEIELVIKMASKGFADKQQFYQWRVSNSSLITGERKMLQIVVSMVACAVSEDHCGKYTVFMVIMLNAMQSMRLKKDEAGQGK